MSAKEKLAELKRQKEELRKWLKTTAKTVFKEMSKGLFEKHKVLKSFKWTQYTPYFNDGGPCVFRSHHSEPDFTFTDGEEVDGWSASRVEGKNKKAAVKAVGDFLGQFDGDDMEKMFGDHAEVIVNKNGVDVEEYEHA